MRRREKKEACKPHGRMLAKVACANPLHVHETIMATVRTGQAAACESKQVAV